MFTATKVYSIVGVGLLLLTCFGAQHFSAPEPKPQQTAAIVIVDDGCNLAGAVPDCKATMAKLMEAQSAHPPEYHGKTLGEIEVGDKARARVSDLEVASQATRQLRHGTTNWDGRRRSITY